MKVKIGISNRHVHLCNDDLRILFGDKYNLTKLKDLTQSKNYSCEETVDLINQDKIIKNVRVVGPCRNYTQVEITKTDSYELNIDPPYKDSGDLEGAAQIIIRGPKGEIKRNCVIIANRHIHMNYEESLKYGYKDNDVVNVKVNDEIIDNVRIKISTDYILELHLDFDDSNQYFIKNGDIGQIL